MSTPGAPGPTDPTQGNPPGPPAYGQSQPGYGQPPPQYGQGQTGYGYAPTGGTPSGPSIVAPQPVQTSFWLWIAASVIGLVGGIVGLVVGFGAAEQAAGAAASQAPGVPVRGIVIGTLIATGVFIALFVALFVVFAVFMRRGRNWARIVLTVLGAISIVSSLPGLIGGSTTTVNGQVIDLGGGPLVAILTVVSILLTVAAIVFSFLKPANEYFADVSARR